MAEETKKPAPEAVPTTEIELLRQQVADLERMRALDGEAIKLSVRDIEALTTRVEALQKDVKAEAQRAENAERKLKAAKSAPVGAVVYLDGKSWAIKGTVKAKFALDEVKKGHIPEDVTLVVIDRIE